MNRVIYIIFLIILFSNNIVCICNNYYSNRLRNTALRLYLFKQKNLENILKRFSNIYEKIYNKSLISVSEGITEYYSLTEEERIIIETVISLIY